MQHTAATMESIRQHANRIPVLDWDHEDTEVTPTTAVGARFRLPLPPPPESESALDSADDWPTLEMVSPMLATAGDGPAVTPMPAPAAASPGRSLLASCSLVALATAAAAAAIVGIIALA